MRRIRWRLLLLLLNSAAVAAAYRPVLPKTSPTREILVVDVLDDWRKHESSEAHSVLLAIACLQGLVNRDAQTKIYLVNFPWRLWWDWSLPARREKVRHWSYGTTADIARKEWVHPARAAIHDGLIPFPATVAKLDTSKKFPALSFLFKHFGSKVKGKVLCPEMKGTHNGGARAAAVNACTFESALPVAPCIDAYLQAEGAVLPAVADTRGMDNTQALQWSAKRYMNAERRNRTVVGYCGDIGGNAPIMYDYFVATGTFAYFLYTETINEPDPADHLYDLLTDAKYYPPGTVHIGPVEGGHAIQRLQKRGHTVVCGYLGNASVTSSIPTRPKTFAPASSTAQSVEKNACYIAWELHDDGDALDVVAQSMYSMLRCDPNFGKVAGGVRVNPYLIDLFPTMFAWYAARPNTEIIASMNDGGASYTKAGQQNWAKNYRCYIDQSNGAIGIVNFFGIVKQPFLAQLNIPFIIAGYLGSSEPSRWSLFGNPVHTVHCTILGPGDNDKKSFCDNLGSTIEELINETQPLFLLCRAKVTPARVKSTMDLIRRQIGDKHKVVWLKPGDLAATYRQWELAQ